VTTCRSVRGLLLRPAWALSETQRLALEHHLDECHGCGVDRGHLAQLREAADLLPLEPLSERDQARVIARALLQGPRAHGEQAPARRRWPLPLLAAAAAAGAVALWFAIADGPQPLRSTATTPGAPTTATVPTTPEGPRPRPDATVLRGRIDAAGVPLPVGAPLPEVPLRAIDAATLALPATQVVLTPGSIVRWSPGARVLALDAGAADLTVDPIAHTRLRVAAARFIVEGTGASFRVTSGELSVSAGSVRVLAPDGRVLAPRVGAGERWMPASPATTADRPVAPPPSAPAASALLATAHATFASGRFADAEQLAARALAADPRRADAAEARALLAECAQAGGRIDDAIDQYRTLAERYADLPPGESALFTAARLAAKGGRAAEARALLERYLERFPGGRYADDARRRLADL
jgi:hypothetical protein